MQERTWQGKMGWLRFKPVVVEEGLSAKVGSIIPQYLAWGKPSVSLIQMRQIGSRGPQYASPLLSPVAHRLSLGIPWGKALIPGAQRGMEALAGFRSSLVPDFKSGTSERGKSSPRPDCSGLGDKPWAEDPGRTVPPVVAFLAGLAGPPRLTEKVRGFIMM